MSETKKVLYRSYRSYLGDMISDLNNIDGCFDEFHNGFQNILNLHDPLKSKTMRGNNQPIFTKELRKAIMKRSWLCNKYLENNTNFNKREYAIQRNLCIKLLRIMKRKYYADLNINQIKDSHTFWKTIRPLFSEKNVMQQNITLLENDTFIQTGITANIFNKFFSNIVHLSK